MSEFERLLGAVTAHPDDDAPRVAFADYIRSSDPDRATFIVEQLEHAALRRERRDVADNYINPLQKRHDDTWTRTIAKYARSWVYDRGFVSEIEIDPDLFLEYGEWLMINAPISVVRFCKPEGAFPLAALAASPLLAKLDGIRMSDVVLTTADIATLAASPHLGRLRYFSFTNDKTNKGSAYEVLAAHPATRKLLVVAVADPAFPGQQFGDTGDDDYWGAAIQGYSKVSEAGTKLEQKYGYIPWLHPEQNLCVVFDAAYYVAQKILPAKPVGSPVS